MLDKKKKISLIVLALLIVAFGGTYAYFYQQDYSNIAAIEDHIEKDKIIIFSQDTGMYDSSLSITLSTDTEVPRSAQLYYTLNGDDPNAEDGILYTGAISLEQDNDLRIYPLKVVLYYNGEYSDIYEKTYVLSTDISNPYNLKIINISTDNDNLYDYETGILIPGKIYDDWVQENGESKAIYHGNYWQRGDEWIRDAHISLFDEDGILLLNQNIGFSVAGNTSVTTDYKSFKIYAGSEYDESYDNFEILLENEGIENSSFSNIEKYNNLRLRSGSQDSMVDYGGTGNIRFPAISTLCQESGFEGISSSNYCLFYINGQFFGIYDIEQTTANSTLSSKFNLYDSDLIEKHEGSEVNCFSNAEILSLFASDLNDVSNRLALEKKVDMDDFLYYYAIEILINNTDWPANNFKIWRYTGEYDETNIYTDGRYRFWITDLDLTYYSNISTGFFNGSNGDILQQLFENTNRGAGSVFMNVINSTYYRDKLLTILRDLLITTFSSDHITTIMEEENKKISEARQIFLGKEYSILAEQNLNCVKQSVAERETEITYDISTYLNLSQMNTIKLSTSEGVQVDWGIETLYQNSTYQNQYYSGTSFTLQATSYPGYTFDHWLINGEIVYGDTYTVSDILYAQSSEIQAIAVPTDEVSIVISSLYAKGSDDWMEIYNAGTQTVTLSDYYISDNSTKLDKYRLPEVNLAPGETIKVYGKKNYVHLNDYITNFSLSEHETVYLSDGATILDQVKIPNMSSVETFTRYENSNTWFFKDID